MIEPALRTPPEGFSIDDHPRPARFSYLSNNVEYLINHTRQIFIHISIPETDNANT